MIKFHCRNKTNKIYEDIVEFEENIEKIDLSYKELIEIPCGSPSVL